VLIKRSELHRSRGDIVSAQSGGSNGEVDRRTFLKRSGVAAGTLAALGNLRLGGIRKAEAGPPPQPGAAITTRKNICTHCSVGCSVIAEVENGVWIGQEPDYDSPINRGSHCCKGAAVRDDARLRRWPRNEVAATMPSTSVLPPFRGGPRLPNSFPRRRKPSRSSTISN